MEAVSKTRARACGIASLEPAGNLTVFHQRGATALPRALTRVRREVSLYIECGKFHFGAQGRRAG